MLLHYSPALGVKRENTKRLLGWAGWIWFIWLLLILLLIDQRRETTRWACRHLCMRLGSWWLLCCNDSEARRLPKAKEIWNPTSRKHAKNNTKKNVNHLKILGNIRKYQQKGYWNKRYQNITKYLKYIRYQETNDFCVFLVLKVQSVNK